MLKPDQKYLINGELARFNPIMEKGLIGLNPVAEFIFDDGRKIKVTYDKFKGSSTASELMDRSVAYRVGAWQFL